MNAQELFDELGKLSVVELEQRLKQLHGEAAATKALLSIAKARQRAKRRSGKANGKTQHIAGAGNERMTI